MIFKDRREAGVYLADKLIKYKNSNAIIYALPRGGVVVAEEIAKVLMIPLSVAFVKKIGHPYNPEYAICALAEREALVCNEAERENVDSVWLKEAIENAKKEIDSRIAEYSKVAPPVTPKNREVILIDDGIATGLTMKAVIKWARSVGVRKIVVAIPVVPVEVALEFRSEVDELAALEISEYYLGSVGSYYINFPQVTDEEVKSILKNQYGRK